MTSMRQRHNFLPIEEEHTSRYARNTAEIVYRFKFRRDDEFDWFSNVQVAAFKTTDGNDDNHYDPSFDSQEEPDGFDEESGMSERVSKVAIREHVFHLANGFARLMCRSQISSKFWEKMEEPSQDTSAMTIDLFNR